MSQNKGGRPVKMNKKYQFFISSTYEDLKEERQKVIQSILSMNQFPVGMEMFSAADEEQWEIIKETIRSSDYYIVIVGTKYGSLIPDGPDAGISYTEKEYNYAAEQKIPIFGFIMDNAAKIDYYKTETDPGKMAKLLAFKEKVKQKYVKFWRNPDELAAQVSQSISKAMLKGDRPGWVRTTDFDIEESYGEILRLTKRVHVLEALNADLKLENIRKPNLWVEIRRDTLGEEGEHDPCEDVRISGNCAYFTVRPIFMGDIQEKLFYRDLLGRKHEADAHEVKMFRHICQNGFPILFYVHNDGDARATGVRVRWKFPNELLVLSLKELMEYITPEEPGFVENAYENWDQRFFSPDEQDEDIPGAGDSEIDAPEITPSMNAASEENHLNTDQFISFDELISISDIADLLDPAEGNEVVSIFAGEVRFEKEEVKHKSGDWLRGIYVLPVKAGEFAIECEIICNEYADVVTQRIKVVIQG